MRICETLREDFTRFALWERICDFGRIHEDLHETLGEDS